VTALEFELLLIMLAHAGWLEWDWTESERVRRPRSGHLDGASVDAFVRSARRPRR
jgi:hypothetical protein